jgi:malonyl CoA-acyl carrier protein transacylase
VANGSIPTGALLAVGAMDRPSLDQHLAESGPGVVVAMDNCANQVILYGAVDVMATLQQRLTGRCHLHAAALRPRLPHARLRYRHQGLPEVLQGHQAGHAPRAAVLCATTGLFPDGATAIRQTAASQWSTTVRFRETIQKMHDDGVRWFIEVGPRPT